MERQEFEARWGATFDAIYSGDPVTGRPFKNSTWSLLPLGISPQLQVSSFNLLDEVLGGVTGGSVLFTQELVGVDHEAPIELPWTEQSLCRDVAGTIFPHLGDFRVTPMTGAWGWCCGNEDLSLFGAPEELVALVLEELGGEDQARRAFVGAASKWVNPDYAAALGLQRGWQVE